MGVVAASGALWRPGVGGRVWLTVAFWHPLTDTACLTASLTKVPRWR